MDYGPFYTVNVSEGANDIPLSAASAQMGPSNKSRSVRINVEDWQNNRINLETIVLNGVRAFRIHGCTVVC